MNAIFEIERIVRLDDYEAKLKEFFLAMLLEGEAKGDMPPFKPTVRNVDVFFETVLEPAFTFDMGVVLVCFVDGVAAGASLWTLDDGKYERDHETAFGHGTYVVPEHRKKGIATRLRRDGEEALRERGVECIIGSVGARNASGIQSAIRGGFRYVGYLVAKKL